MTTKPKYENNWRFKTLENLEKDYWVEPGYESHLVLTCHNLRKKPLNEFNAEELRIMIRQDIGLKFLIPIALETFENNILEEGDYYEGDLLEAVLKIEKSFWLQEPTLYDKLSATIKENEDLLKTNNPTFLSYFVELKKS